MIAVEKVNAVGPVCVPQTTVQNVHQIPTVVSFCIAVDIGISLTTMSADEVASERRALAIRTVPCLMNIASRVKHVGLPDFTVDTTVIVRVMANAVSQAYVLLLTAHHASRIPTVAGRRVTVVNAAACPTSVAQAVSESTVRLIVIVEGPVCTVVSVVILQTLVAQAASVNIVQLIMTVDRLTSFVI